jgi:hypothetical protein
MTVVIYTIFYHSIDYLNSLFIFTRSCTNSHIFDGHIFQDDDEGDIFEDDEEEDEGYLFVGQGICAKYRMAIKSSTYLPKLLWLKCHF